MALPKLYDRIIWHNNTTPALNEDNLNAMSKGLDDVDDRLIDLAGTIMEDVPQILEDMEILGPAVENIDENVARAEEAAESAKQYAEEIAPPIEVIKDYAPIISIADAINKPVKDLKVKVDAVQDLHGYTKPWVGGAGNNLVDLNGFSVSNGVTKTVSGDKVTVVADGTSTVYQGIQYGNSNNTLFPAGTYYVKYNVVSNTNTSIYQNVGFRNSSNAFVGSSAGNLTVGQHSGIVTTGVDTYFSIVVNGTEASSRAATVVIENLIVSKINVPYEPYENICPISGFTEVNLYRYRDTAITYDPNSNGKYIGADGTIGSSGNFHYTNLLPVVQASYSYKYTTARTEFSTRVHAYNENGVWLRQLGYKTTSTQSVGENEITFDVDSSVSYIRISQSTEVSDELLIRDNTQYIIDLNGTRYGGTLDVTSGVLTLTHGFVTLDGSDDETYSLSGNSNRVNFYNLASVIKKVANNNDIGEIISNRFPTVSALNTWNGIFGVSIDTDGNIGFSLNPPMVVADFKTWLASNNVQLCYKLATPQTITLTPTEVELLWAYNTLFADTGDLSLTYDASGVLRIANAKLDIDTFKSIVAASSDFADFKTRVAAL